MKKIVCIDEGILRPGINNIGDIVDVYGDDAVLGPAYDIFMVIEIDIDMSVEDLKIKLSSMVPEVRKVFRISDTNEWTFDDPEEKKVWKNPTTDNWCDLIEEPKYSLTTINLTNENLIDLKKDSILVTTIVKENILNLGLFDNMSLKAKNMTSVDELNKVTELIK